MEHQQWHHWSLEGRVDDTASVQQPARKARRVFPWVVFTLTFALLLSDYMSRQVLSAVFPFLKQEWALTDTQLGSLTSVVPLTVGVLAVPLSLLGDRWGRVKSIVLMAVVWSLATLGSALAANYGQLMLARVFIGVGEAAYGSVGLAVVLAVFPVYRRASLTGAFMAGGSFGSVLGVALGGVLAVQFGWRWAFAAMAILGLVLVVLYRLFITDEKLEPHRVDDVADGPQAVARPGERAKLRTLFTTPSVISAYIGSGLQLFIAGSLFAWLPSYLNRAYGLAPDKAAGLAAIAILLMGVGMIVCGVITDRLEPDRADPQVDDGHRLHRGCRWSSSASASRCRTGGAQLLLLAIGVFFAAGTAGPAGAMVASLTHESIRATALGTLTLANNLLGLAAGPLDDRHPGRPVRPGRRHEDRPDRGGGRPDRAADRPQALRRQPRQGQRPGGRPMTAADRRPRPGSARATSRTTGRPGSPPRCRTPGTVPPLGRTTPTCRRGWPCSTRWSSRPTGRWSWSRTAPGVLVTVHWAARRGTTRGSGRCWPPRRSLATELPAGVPVARPAPGARLAADPARTAAVPQHRRRQHRRPARRPGPGARARGGVGQPAARRSAPSAT